MDTLWGGRGSGWGLHHPHAERQCTCRRLAHQPVSPEPACGVGADADGVLARVVGGESEATLGSVVPREHYLAKGVLDLREGGGRSSVSCRSASLVQNRESEAGSTICAVESLGMRVLGG